MADRPRPPHIDTTERRYRRRLLARVRAAKLLLDERLAPVLARIEARRTERTDAAVDLLPPDLTEILRVISTVRAAFEMAYQVATTDLTHVGEQVALFTARKLHDDYPTVFAISTGRDAAEIARVAEWSRVNARLIKTIDSRYWDDVAEVTREAVGRGIQTRELSALLQERYKVSESRAKLIARDQISKLNADITEQKQTSLGVEEYWWVTSHDERVRPTHRNLDGTLQRWDSPPVSETNGERNHPGQAVSCRCSARPKVPGYERTNPARFETPTLTATRPTLYGSRERQLTAKDRSDLRQRLGR
jgi:SPP1 gp7 family putative phage head morphogenesis protein